jgi:tetratricopeptide (TPR) repeat protein
MSTRGVDCKRLAALALAVLLVTAAAAAAAPVSSPQVTGLEMTTPLRQTLKQLEEQWLRWIVQNDRQEAEAAVNDLLDTARQLEMKRLPDLSAAAVGWAVQAARQKDFPRAHWALDAAERFDPGRPETAFAEASVELQQGNYLGAVAARLRAYPRMLFHPLERYLWLQDLLIWSLLLLLVTGGLFLAVQMLTKGASLFRDLADFLARRLPRPLAVAVAALVLLWPLVFSPSFLWLALYWSILLWGYGSASERAVLIALWLLLGTSPLLLDAQNRRIAVALSPPARAMQSLEEHRLYGGLFSDLGVLRSLLPQSVAVKHLLADVHRSLKQGEMARSLYRQVLEEEPENASALLNLGVYYFLKRDFNGAIQNFQKAAEVDPMNAVAQYNLSQAYSESYLFDEQRAALRQAQEIDLARVNAWMANPQQRVVPVAGGMARVPEIRRQLLASLSGGREARSVRLELFRRGLSLLFALSLVLVAVALHLARRPFGYKDRAAGFPEGAFDRWSRILLPGVTAAEIGEGGRAFVSLLLPTALLMLPLFGRLGVRIPWRYDPGNLSWIIAVLGFLLYFVVRLRRELRGEI